MSLKVACSEIGILREKERSRKRKGLAAGAGHAVPDTRRARRIRRREVTVMTGTVGRLLLRSKRNLKTKSKH